MIESMCFVIKLCNESVNSYIWRKWLLYSFKKKAEQTFVYPLASQTPLITHCSYYYDVIEQQLDMSD